MRQLKHIELGVKNILCKQYLYLDPVIFYHIEFDPMIILIRLEYM